MASDPWCTSSPKTNHQYHPEVAAFITRVDTDHRPGEHAGGDEANPAAGDHQEDQDRDGGQQPALLGEEGGEEQQPATERPGPALGPPADGQGGQQQAAGRASRPGRC